MRFKEHLSKSLTLEKAPSPWPRMILSGLSVLLPLMLGYARNELSYAIFGSLLGFVLILNDHFGPLNRRILHLITAYLFILTGYASGLMMRDNPWLLISAIFCMSFLLAKSKGLGMELERMLLFTTLQMIASSQTPDLRDNYFIPLMYATFSMINYLVCLCIIYLLMRHATNFHKSKRTEFKEALKRGNNRYAFTLASMACIGLMATQYLQVKQGYWVVGTILIVMMPDHYSSLYRSFQRLLGTTIGVVLASLIIKFGNYPAVLISFCTLCAFLAPLGLMRNYWLGNVFIAGLILFFLEISNRTPHTGDFDLAIIRMTDIGLGCLLGSIGTLIAFPEVFKKQRINKE
jgi:hypothetical protein